MTYLGTVSHKPYGAAAGISYDAPFPSTLATRRYMCGLTEPHYPVPAIPLACAILPDLVQIAEVYWLDAWLETQDTLHIQRAEFELVAEFEKE